LQRLNEEEKVSLTFSKPSASSSSSSSQSTKSDSSDRKSVLEPSINPLNNLSKTKRETSSSVSSIFSSKKSQKRKSALEEIIEEDKSKQSKVKRSENWITKGIIVKVITKKLGEKYYKKKGTIKDIKDKFSAIVDMIDSGDVLKLDQAHLETVIPQPGRLMKIVNGVHRGETAKMLSIDEKTFSVGVKLESGVNKGSKIEQIPYEDVCKLA